MTFWFLWTSPAFFRCPRLHPVITVRSKPPPSRPQYCNTRISTFCAFNCQRTGIERQKSQSRAKPNQERPETASHAPHAPAEVSASQARAPRTATRHQYLPRASRAPTRQSTLTHAPHAPAVASLPATSTLGDVTLPRQHTSSVDC